MYSTTISRTFKNVTNSGTFENDTILFSFLDGLNTFVLCALTNNPAKVALLNVPLIGIL